MKNLTKWALECCGYRVQSIRYVSRQMLDPRDARALGFDDVICKRMVDVGPELVFIQIGGFDGRTADPLCKYIDQSGWRGVIVEPQPGPAEALQARYRHSGRIIVLEAAIDGSRDSRTLFTVDPEGMPRWAGGLASFERHHLTKHAGLILAIESRIRAIEVGCIDCDEVMAKLPSNRIDLLQIDAEGADADILFLFPFERVRPSIVHWEIKNLTRAVRQACLDRLTRFDCRFAPSGDEDMLAVLEDAR